MSGSVGFPLISVVYNWCVSSRSLVLLAQVGFRTHGVACAVSWQIPQYHHTGMENYFFIEIFSSNLFQLANLSWFYCLTFSIRDLGGGGVNGGGVLRGTMNKLVALRLTKIKKGRWLSSFTSQIYVVGGWLIYFLFHISYFILIVFSYFILIAFSLLI